jgi:pimeloyl-ACP methyl ester carboxylesterase
MSWATRGSVRLEMREWRPSQPGAGWGLPIVCVHGAIGSALSFADEGVAAAAGRIGSRARPLLGFSRRGMAGSDTPRTGYRLEDFVADLAAVVAASAYRRSIVFGHSFGVPIAISFAAQHGDLVAGLVLGDYGPRYPALSEDWIRRVEERFDREAADPGGASFRIEAMREMQRDSRAIALDDAMAALRCPVLVLTGDRSDVLLTADDRASFERSGADVRIVTIAGAGHGLDVEGRNDALLSVLGAFVDRVDELGWVLRPR